MTNFSGGIPPPSVGYRTTSIVRGCCHPAPGRAIPCRRTRPASVRWKVLRVRRWHLTLESRVKGLRFCVLWWECDFTRYPGIIARWWFQNVLSSSNFHPKDLGKWIWSIFFNGVETTNWNAIFQKVATNWAEWSLLVDSAGMAPCFRNSANQLISRNMPLLIVFPIEWVAGFLNHPKFSDHLWMTYLATNTTTTTTTFTFHSTVTWFGAWQSLASKLSNCPRIGMPRRVQRRWRLGRLFRRVNRKVAFPPNCDGAKAPWWNQTLEVILISGKLLSICCVQIHRYGTIYIYIIYNIFKNNENLLKSAYGVDVPIPNHLATWDRHGDPLICSQSMVMPAGHLVGLGVLLSLLEDGNPNVTD